jgi:hypothetical protein
MASPVDILVRVLGGQASAVQLGLVSGAMQEITRRAIDATVRLAGMVERSIELADETGKLAQRAGVTTEALSTLAYAAELSDVSLQELTDSFRFLNDVIANSVNGNAAAARTLRRVGVEAGPVDEMLLQIADRFADLPDGAQKSALAVDLFGRAGTRLIPFLNAGRAGIEELRAEARRLGLEISGDFARDAEEFNDNLTRIRKTVDGMVLSLSRDLMPLLDSASKALLAAQQASPGGIFGLSREQAATAGKGLEGLAGHLLRARVGWSTFIGGIWDGQPALQAYTEAIIKADQAVGAYEDRLADLNGNKPDGDKPPQTPEKTPEQIRAEQNRALAKAQLDLATAEMRANAIAEEGALDRKTKVRELTFRYEEQLHALDRIQTALESIAAAADEDERLKVERELLEVSERRYELERKLRETGPAINLTARQAALDSDWKQTPGEKRDEQTAIYRGQLDSGQINQEQYDNLVNQMGPDPRDFGDQWTAMLTRLRAENEAYAEHFMVTLGDSFSQSIDMASNALAGAVFQTNDWLGSLQRIPLVIGQQIVAALIKMGIQWIITRLTISATEQATATSEAAAKAPGALMDSISSYGVAALVGAAAFAAAMALAGGFAEGGMVRGPGGPTDDRVLARLSAGEGVLNARAMQRLGEQNLNRLNAGGDLAAVLPGRGGGAAAGNGQPVLRNDVRFVGVVDSVAIGMKALESEQGQRFVLDLMRSRIHEVTGRG